MNKPKEPPPKEPDSLEKLRDFTKRILRVPKDELKDKRASTGTIKPLSG
jgi:hypothetical protein